MAVAIIDRDHQLSAAEAEADAYQTAAVIDTMPIDEFKTGLEVRTDDDALAAAYAALGDLAPSAVEVQGELGSQSARDVGREQLRDATGQPVEIALRKLPA